jgi:hypothetical protein
MELRQMTIAELAEDAFLKAEHVKALAMMNTPTDFEERKKAFIQMEIARAAALESAAALWKAQQPIANPSGICPNQSRS